MGLQATLILELQESLFYGWLPEVFQPHFHNEGSITIHLLVCLFVPLSINGFAATVTKLSALVVWD